VIQIKGRKDIPGMSKVGKSEKLIKNHQSQTEKTYSNYDEIETVLSLSETSMREDFGKKSQINSKNEKLPHPSEFNNFEYESLLESLNMNSSNYVLFQQNDDVITRNDVRKLENDEIITDNTMSMFANYLSLLQKQYENLYNEKNLNRCFLVVVKINGFDKIKQMPDYVFLNSTISYKDNVQEFCSNFDKFIFIVQYDERWTVIVLNLFEGDLSIADFLSKGLSGIKSEDILERMKLVIRSEFPSLFVQSKKTYDVSKLNFLSDCGIYAMSFVYKCINNSILDNIHVNYWEKDLFRKQLVWLFLKVSMMTKNKVHNQHSEASSLSSRIRPKIPTPDKVFPSLDDIPTSLTKYTNVSLKAKSYNIIPDEDEELSESKSFKKSKFNLMSSNNHTPKIIEQVPKQKSRFLAENQKSFFNNSKLTNHFKNHDELSYPNFEQHSYNQEFSSNFSTLESISTIMPKTLKSKRKTHLRRRVVESLNDLDSKFQEMAQSTNSNESKISNIKKGSFPKFTELPQTLTLSQFAQTDKTSHLILPPLRGKSPSRDAFKENLKLPKSKFFEPNKQYSSLGSLIPNKGDFDWNNNKSVQIQEVEDNESNPSPNVVLFGFQEGNSKPQRINIRLLEENEKKQRTLGSSKEMKIKKSNYNPYERYDYCALFSYEHTNNPQFSKQSLTDVSDQVNYFTKI